MIVVDTNVFAVAEGLHPEASDSCRAACIEIVERIRGGTKLVVDSGDEILNEAMDRLRAGQRSGLATKTISRIYRTRNGGDSCDAVDITPCEPPPGTFEEVPSSLRDFDVDDQKFIAVAATHPAKPLVFQALDGEWWDRQRDFADAGILVQFLCAADYL